MTLWLAHRLSSSFSKYSPCLSFRAGMTCRMQARCLLNSSYGTLIRKTCTMLIYLDEDFTGSKTHFVNIDLTISPKTGKAVLCYNLNMRVCAELP